MRGSRKGEWDLDGIQSITPIREPRASSQDYYLRSLGSQVSESGWYSYESHMLLTEDNVAEIAKAQRLSDYTSLRPLDASKGENELAQQEEDDLVDNLHANCRVDDEIFDIDDL